MRKRYALALLAAAVYSSNIGRSQSGLQQPVTETVISGISSTWPGECGGSLGAIDNSSAVSRQNLYHSVYVTSGTGTWSVAINYSTVSCSGPWTTFGSASSINQSSSPAIAYGLGNFAYIQVAITGNAIVTYAAVRSPFLSTATGSVSFPITIAQGGTNATTQAGALANILGSSAIPIANGGTNATTQSQALSNILGGVPLPIANGGTNATTSAGALASLLSGNAQGTYTNKVQMAGTNSNSAGAPLCDDASGNATTSGCAPTLPSGSQTQFLQIQPNTGNNTTIQWTSKPMTISSDYNFPAQTPGGSISIGSNTVSLSPCPLGVNGSDSSHYLYLSGGTGTAEGALITGGTCTSGASSGTVIVTAGNTHSGAWTVTSVGGGSPEAAIAAGVGAVIQIPQGITLHVYAPVTFLAGQWVSAYGALIERDFSSSGNVFNFTGSAAAYGGMYGGKFTVGGGITEPSNSYKIYALGITYFTLDSVQFSGGWGNVFLDHIARGSVSNYGADTFSGDNMRLGSTANGGTGITATNITTSDGTGTGTALHMIDALVNLSNFDFQGLGGGSNTSKGIYFDAPTGATADESTIGPGIIDSMANGIQANPSTYRFFNVIFDGIYMNTTNGGQCFDLPPNGQSIHISNSVLFGCGGGSGGIVFRGGSEITVEDTIVENQTGTTPYGLGFIGNITNARIANFSAGFNADGSANGGVAGGIYFGPFTFAGVTIDGGEVPASNGINITTPTTGITIRNVKGWNPVGPSSISPGGSPYTYTAGNSPETVYWTAGTIVTIKRGTQTVCVATPCTVYLSPNQSVVTTYTGGAPTMVKDVQ